MQAAEPDGCVVYQSNDRIEDKYVTQSVVPGDI